MTRLPRGRSAAWAVTDRGDAMKRQGVDVVDLGVGDPDLNTPTPVIDALEAALRAGRTHYSPVAGEPALRAAVAADTALRTGAAVVPEQVFVFPGAQCALFATLLCVAGAGDEVIVLEPAYTTYERCIAAAGAEIVSVALDKASDFALDVDAVRAALTPRTRAIIVNSPNNPSGAVFDRESLERLTRLCADRGIWCIADEVYHGLVYHGSHHSPLATAAGGDCVIIVDSLSKSHAMTGWRIGWTVAPAPVGDALAQLTPSMLFGVNQFVQDAATLALRNRDELTRPLFTCFAERRRRVLDALQGAARLRALEPEGGMFVLVDVAATGLDGIAFADALFDAERIVVVPGAAFGEAARSCIRIGLTTEADRLEAAVARLRRFADG